jgi:hypothetical protein
LLTARDCSSWTSEMKPAAPHNTRQWNPAMHKQAPRRMNRVDDIGCDQFSQAFEPVSGSF